MKGGLADLDTDLDTLAEMVLSNDGDIDTPTNTFPRHPWLRLLAQGISQQPIVRVSSFRKVVKSRLKTGVLRPSPNAAATLRRGKFDGSWSFSSGLVWASVWCNAFSKLRLGNVLAC